VSLLLLFGVSGGGPGPEPEPETGIIARPITGGTVTAGALSGLSITASPLADASGIIASPIQGLSS